MLSVTDLPFHPPEFPGQFRAYGYLYGKFEPFSEQANPSLTFGYLLLKKGSKLKMVFPRRLWLNLTEKQSINLDHAYLWRVYCRTNREGQITQVQVVNFTVLEGKNTLRHSPPSDSGADYFLISGQIAFVNAEKVVVRIKRNGNPPKGGENKYHWKPFLITLLKELSQEPQIEVGQFWEFLGSREDDQLKIRQSHLISPSELNQYTNALSSAKDLVQPSSKQKKSAQKTASTESQSLKISETLPKNAHSPSNDESSLIMINGRTPEITVKFSERPECPEQGKKVTLQVTDDKGITVKAEINRKTLKKQVDKMDSFADWVAALSGKIVGISTEGVIELESAGLTVFERKPKEDKDKSDSSVKSNQEHLQEPAKAEKIRTIHETS